MENMLPLRKTPGQFLQRQPPPSPPDSPIEIIEPSNQTPHLAVAPPNQPPIPLPNSPWPEPQSLSKPRSESVLLPTDSEQPLQLPNAPQHQNNLDFPTLLLVAACLAVATEIATQSLQIHAVHPMYFHSFTLIIILVAFASIFVAKYIAPKHPKAGSVLDKLGVFLGFTAFFLAVTIPLPLSLRIISWIIYVLSLLAIRICNK